MALTENEKTRYDRQMMVEGWGEAGQEKLKAATVFIAGAGGLGCPVSVYLAVAGVGQIRICDADRVELSNLNRQIHYTEAHVGQSKAEAAGAQQQAQAEGGTTSGDSGQSEDGVIDVEEVN